MNGNGAPNLRPIARNAKTSRTIPQGDAEGVGER